MGQERAPRERRWLRHGAIGAAIALVYVASPGGGSWELVFSAVGAWAALGVAAVARKQHRATATALWLVAAGLGAAACGDLVLAVHELRGEEAPFPSFADVGYLSGYLLLSAGLVSLARHRVSRESLIDACIVTAGISGVVWLSVVTPLLDDGLSVSSAVAISYPVGAVLLLVTSMQLVLSWGRHTAGTRLLGIGLLSWLVADAVYAHQALDGTYQHGTLLDAGWLLAYVLVGAGAMHPSMHAREGAGRGAGTLTPHRFLLLAVAAASTPAATALFRLEPVAPLMVLTVFGIVLSALRLSGPVQSLRDHAYRDALTGLPNRPAALQQLRGELERLHHEPGSGIALLFCDLDHFKVINDSLGHPAGDELLRTIARRLRSCAAGVATVARLGGDEFVILVPASADPQADAEALAGAILAEVAQPVQLAGGHEVRPSLSIGIRTTHEADADLDDLVSDADSAMYAAKARGRGGASSFDPVMRQAALDRLLVETELRDAIASRRIHCVFQPAVDVHTGSLFALECLARWDHPRLGLLEPERFLPHAEANGTVDELFALVLEDALSAQQAWTQLLGARPVMAVNLSAAQRTGHHLADVVLDALGRYEAPADSLWIEVTETALADDDLAAAMRALRSAGVRVAVDDFGTGWSSLSRLAECQWDALKIDRDFVAHVADAGSEVSQVVAATVAMAHALGMLAVASGVETEAELERVRDLGCDVVQGEAVSAPVLVDEVVALLRRPGLLSGAPPAPPTPAPATPARPTARTPGR